MDFHNTGLGKKFLNKDIPKLEKALTRIAASLEIIAKLAKEELADEDAIEKSPATTRSE